MVVEILDGTDIGHVGILGTLFVFREHFCVLVRGTALFRNSVQLVAE